MAQIQKYKSDICVIAWDSRGFYDLKFKANTYYGYDEKEVKNQIEFFKNETKGEFYNVLLDSRSVTNLPTELGINFYNNYPELNCKTAILVNEQPSEMFFNSAIKHYKMKGIGLFKDKNKALEWLLGN